jgi:glycosyltransferase involved in cell wall biosynthesis
MRRPLVSILIPAYNAERWIVASVQSAIAQDWPRTEVIVVDDGSRDGTLETVRRLESSHVKVVTQENGGASAARNRALSLAQGDYVQWLDADDLLAPDKLSRQLEVGSAEGPGVLLSSAFGRFYSRSERAVFSPTLLWRDLSPVDWIATKFANNLWMAHLVWLVSRDLTEAAGPWNEALSLDDDGEYFCRVVAKSRMVRFVPDARSYYRQWNLSSLSRGASLKASRSLLTSVTLSTGHLLALEDSQRTRDAALSYLGVLMHYFYPEKKELLEELQALAARLGHRLDPPKLSLKYELIKRVIGWQGAETTRRLVARARLWVHRSLDRLP